MNTIIFVILIVLDHIRVAVRVYYAILCISRTRRMLRIGAWARSSGHFLLSAAEKFCNIRFRLLGNFSVLPDQAVIVSNHQSLLDIYLCLSVFRRQLPGFIAKRELRFIPGVSETLRYGHHVLIDRTLNLRETNTKLKKFAKKVERYGTSPCVYPEGSRSKDGQLREFNAGAYKIIQRECALPTIVLAVDGGWKLRKLVDFFQKSKYIYTAKVLSILPPPRNKTDIISNLHRAHSQIKEQLETWRKS